MGEIEWNMSSQISMAARPHRVSNARIECPASTNRSSWNTPYVGRNTFRCTCTTRGSPPPSSTYSAELYSRWPHTS